MKDETAEQLRRREVAAETARLVDAHCLHCGKQLIFENAYFKCPEHGMWWYLNPQ